MIYLTFLLLGGPPSPTEPSKNSILWSVARHAWLEGPAISNTNYIFINACALAINASSVLFIGLSVWNPWDHLPINLYFIPNNITAIYNFESDRWQQQDSLYFPDILPSVMNVEFSYEFTCSVLNEKTQQR